MPGPFKIIFDKTYLWLILYTYFALTNFTFRSGSFSAQFSPIEPTWHIGRNNIFLSKYYAFLTSEILNKVFFNIKEYVESKIKNNEYWQRVCNCFKFHLDKRLNNFTHQIYWSVLFMKLEFFQNSFKFFEKNQSPRNWPPGITHRNVHTGTSISSSNFVVLVVYTFLSYIFTRIK